MAGKEDQLTDADVVRSSNQLSIELKKKYMTQRGSKCEINNFRSFADGLQL